MSASLVAHADWGSSTNKRWLARAVRGDDGRYRAMSSEPVGMPSTLLARLRRSADPTGCVVVGFDFPIGVPAFFGRRAGIDDFPTALRAFGAGVWLDFYRVAEHADEISLRRPFYPQRPGASNRGHLLDALGAESIDDLRRRCERAAQGRRAAAPLFWTLGGQQVGKAAISGWQEVLVPALRSSTAEIALWPFDGALATLLLPGRIVVVETYPAEYYRHLGVRFPASAVGQRSGKRVRADRRAAAPALLRWAETAGVIVVPELATEIADGFGSGADGEDRFDAVIGLFGMLDVLTGRRGEGAPEDEAIRRVEGWILGQEPTRAGRIREVPDAI